MAGRRETTGTRQAGRSPAGCGPGWLGSLPRAPLPRRMAADEGTWPGTPAQWPRSGRVASYPPAFLPRTCLGSGTAGSSGSLGPHPRRWPGWRGQAFRQHPRKGHRSQVLIMRTASCRSRRSASPVPARRCRSALCLPA